MADSESESGNLRRDLEAHHAACFGWAMSCAAHDRTLAEDALHAAYEKFLSRKIVFAGKSSFRVFLFGVIRLTVFEERRRRRWTRWFRFEEREESFASEPRMSSSDEAKIRQALASLPERQREVLHLVFYEEMSIAEAALAMNVSLGTARQHYERGKARLRQTLEGNEE